MFLCGSLFLDRSMWHSSWGPDLQPLVLLTEPNSFKNFLRNFNVFVTPLRSILLFFTILLYCLAFLSSFMVGYPHDILQARTSKPFSTMQNSIQDPPPRWILTIFKLKFGGGNLFSPAMISTIEGNNSVRSFLKPLLKKATPVVGSRMLCN